MNPQHKLTLTKGQALARMLAEQRAEELDMITSAMTPEQITAAIEAEGISRSAQAAYFARQDERIRAAIARQPAPANVVPIRRDVAAPKEKRSWFPPTRRDVKVGAGATAATTVVALAVIRAVMVAAPEALPLVATAAASAPSPDQPDRIREQAFIACGQGHWQVCLESLDRAKELDPEGEASESVKTARTLATNGLRKR